MKFIRQHSVSIGFILILSSLLFISCKKNDTDQKSSLRLKTTYYYYPGQTLNKVVDSNIYVGDRLSVSYIYAQYGIHPSNPSSMTTYEYDGNKVIVRNYFLNSDDTIFSNRKTYVVENDHIISMLSEPVISAGSTAQQKMIYEYDGNLPVRVTYSSCSPFEEWTNDAKSEYYYSNSIIDSILEFTATGSDSWEKSGKLKFEYSGEQISRIVHYSYTSGTYNQDNVNLYTYSGENIASISSDNPAETFEYDEWSNLTTYSGGTSSFPVKTLQYEAGTGNYAFIQYLNDPLSKIMHYPVTVNVP